MTRAESIALLHAWAHPGPHSSRLNGYDGNRFGLALDAEDHGENAVRAIRAVSGIGPDDIFDFTDHDMTAKHEARAAFRCALAAVDLKSL